MEEKITFEEALARLEELVRSLEEGKLPLAESLAAFEEGVALLRRCTQELEEAEGKVEVLLQDENGNVFTKLFEEAEDV
ncbi:MAG: exodeoxyribonuclease VII small subunit [Firmicutes bacterium]|jgi:exodeoxyribonuclease VII small subunit|nr:exodeoxyribonuclease VII small subunit [Bacillota bacterium]HOB22546.1 exodeoxyribonuclease VII small subunit [Bacillota bacterium]HQD40566.1 exodeoxyribonuclease VII small subunit [Bacillota bacterium]